MTDREEDILDIREWSGCTCPVVEQYFEDTKHCDSDCGCDIRLSDYEHEVSCPYRTVSIQLCL